MRLLELFKKTLPYEWVNHYPFPAAEFSTGKTNYLVGFMPWEQNFGDYSDSEIPLNHETIMGAMIANPESGDMESGNYLSGVGNEFLVFSTALKIFEDFLDSHQPECFAVAALVAERRHVVYAKIMQRVMKRIERSGYRFVDEETMQQTPFGPMHAFYLLRQDLT